MLLPVVSKGQTRHNFVANQRGNVSESAQYRPGSGLRRARSERDLTRVNNRTSLGEGWTNIMSAMRAKGFSGTWTPFSRVKDSRPALNRLMADASRRRFDAVTVWKFDRFARSVSHLLRALEQFNALGIAFVSLSEQMDTTTPAGKMVFTVLGAVAELEFSLIAERVRAGLRNAKAKGRRLGRPRVVVDAHRIAALRGSGASWATVWPKDSSARGRHSARFSACPKTICHLLLRQFLVVFSRPTIRTSRFSIGARSTR
jgi:hypothetical protein